jgi:hypothetical protein
MFRRMLGAIGERSYRADIERYNLLLEGASDSERGMMLLSAALARLSLEARGMPAAVFLSPFVFSKEALVDALARVADRHKQALRDAEEISSAGLGVWRHTLRCASVQEIRVQGRKMWGFLLRGEAEARALAEKMATTGLNFSVPGPWGDSVDAGVLLVNEVGAVPSGLEPRDDAGNELSSLITGEAVLDYRARFFADIKAAHDAREAKLRAEREAIETERRAREAAIADVELPHRNLALKQDLLAALERHLKR